MSKEFKPVAAVGDKRYANATKGLFAIVKWNGDESIEPVVYNRDNKTWHPMSKAKGATFYTDKSQAKSDIEKLCKGPYAGQILFIVTLKAD